MLPNADRGTVAQRASRRSDTVLAVLAAVATIGFAWAGFQGAEWVRERFLRSDNAAALSEQALELSAEADRSEERDTLLYVEWRVALDGGDEATADVVFELLRPELQAYLLEKLAGGRDLPLEPPFDKPGYDVADDRAEADRLDERSRDQNALSRQASKNGALYGGLGVLFAAVLAAVGIAGRFHDLWIRRVLTIAAGGLLALGLTFLVLSPLHVSAP